MNKNNKIKNLKDSKAKTGEFTNYMNKKEEEDAELKLLKGVLIQILLSLLVIVDDHIPAMKIETRILLFKCQFDYENVKGVRNKAIVKFLSILFSNEMDNAESEYLAYKQDHMIDIYKLQGDADMFDKTNSLLPISQDGLNNNN